MSEPATSTADWEDLAAAVAEQKATPARQPALTVADLAFASFEKLIEEADGLPEQPESTPEPPACRRLGASLTARNGWPERVIQARSETTGGEWKAAYALAAPVVESGGIVVLHGTRGTGKTRMAGELARDIQFPFDVSKGTPTGVPIEKRRTALYRTAMSFFTEIRSTYRKNAEESESQIIERLGLSGLLVIDELQERGESAFEDRLLTHLIDQRYGAMLPTILICNLTKEQLFQTVSPSVADRIAENGIRLECNWPSYRRTGR